MLRKSGFLIVLALLLLSAGTTFAQQGPISQHSASLWEVTFWNNMTLSGDPTLVSTQDKIDWDWGTGSPNAAIPADRFSARWSRIIDLAAGTYRFTATSDDGIRVTVDDRLVIDQWNDHAVSTYTADVSLAAGHHRMVVEYYENKGQAVAKFSWAPAPVTINGWRGEYFNIRDLSGSPIIVRDDQAIDFDWGYGSAAAGLPSDRFSVRWTHTPYFSPGHYRFTTTSDDGVRLWVDGHLLIDQWHDQAATSHSGTMYVAGAVPVKMEYYENGGLAMARLSWVPDPGTPAPDPVPSPGTVIVDDSGAGFVRGGSSRAWRSASEGYNGQLTWTRNNDRMRPGYNWARWYPSLESGRYEVFVHIPDRYSTTINARYWVSHYDGYTVRIVNQSAPGGQWVSLGTYRFRGNSSDYVSLADVTFEPYLSSLIAFDAAKWERR